MNKSFACRCVCVRIGSGTLGMAEIVSGAQIYPTLEGLRPLVLFVPVFCVGVSLAMLVVGDAHDRFTPFCRGAFALVAALQSADIPEFKQYFFQTSDVLALRKTAVAALPFAALLMPILLRVQSRISFLFKIVLLFLCFAVVIAIFFFRLGCFDGASCLYCFLFVQFSRCSVWTALTHKDGYGWASVLVSCSIF